jgi:hypothetical protein
MTRTAATTTTGGVIARCSFCAKPNTEVERLVAGPGVYICDECVALCSTIIEDSRGAPPVTRFPEWSSLTDDQMLDHIPRIAATVDQVEGSLRSWIGEVRSRGVTWARIGQALGTTRQSAWERFSGEE